MNRVAVIDYGVSNLDSVKRSLEDLGACPYIVGSGDELGAPDRIVLPGVGAFGVAMANLESRGLLGALDDAVREGGVPLLGICLGMQLLASEGTEGEATAGLGWIPGRVVRFEPQGEDRRIPHVGWNELVHSGTSQLFDGIESGRDVYFVHSYHLIPESATDAVGTTPYCGGFVSAVARGTIFGVQFHPEKSQRIGAAVLRNFLRV
jgi:imidazole glycerol-phosphate synthase subunit HisH